MDPHTTTSHWTALWPFRTVPLQTPQSALQFVQYQAPSPVSPNKEGLTAERLKYGGDSILETVTDTVSDILNSGKIPKVFKEGLITPVYKKQGKPTSDPISYRRTTITSILGKIVMPVIKV